MRPVVIVCAAGLSVGAAAVGQVAPAAVSTPDLLRRYAADREVIVRFYAMDWSESRFDRLDQFYAEWQERQRGVDLAGLDRASRIDMLLLRDHLAGERQELVLRRAQLAEMDAVLPLRREVQELELGRMRMVEVDPRKAASVMAKLTGEAKALKDRVKRVGKPAGEAGSTPADGKEMAISPTVARRAAGAVSGMRETMRRWYEFHASYRPEFAWWVRKPYEEAGAALDAYAKHLRETVAGLKGEDADPLLGDPIGRPALVDELRREAVAYTPEELIAIGERELAWCEAEMRRAAAEMGLGDDWKGAIERVKQASVPPGEQDNLVTAQARAAIEFVTSRDLVTVPALAREAWTVQMLSAQSQKVLPFAAYSNLSMLVAYPTEGMSHDDKLMSMRGNNTHFTRIVTPHELIPGHHLQRFMADRYRPERSVFSTPFYVEGWALHWEMLLWDLGYAEKPEDRVGMLFWRMHRCARIIVSLKFHLGQMTPAEMVDFLVDRIGHERFGATSEVRRYIAGDYGPLYQVAYMMGGLQMRALKRELVDGGRMSLKDFHDAVLKLGPIPIEYVRASLREDVELSADRAASWRFADEAK